MLDLIVKNGRVVLRDRVETTSIGVKDGKIVRIAPTIDEEAKSVCDAAGCMKRRKASATPRAATCSPAWSTRTCT